jgi:hypothetical protein
MIAPGQRAIETHPILSLRLEDALVRFGRQFEKPTSVVGGVNGAATPGSPDVLRASLGLHFE